MKINTMHSNEENNFMSEEFNIIDNTDKAKIINGINYRGYDVSIDNYSLLQLINGKSLAINIDNEYTVFLHI